MAEKKEKTSTDTSFEQAIARLEAIVRELEDGRLPLGEALDLFTEGMELTCLCDQRLGEAEQRLAVLTVREDGEICLQESNAAAGDDNVEL